MTRPDKAKLIDELKSYLQPEDYNYHTSESKPVLFIDFMSHFRSQVFNTDEHPTFEKVLTETVSRILRQFKDVDLSQFIFDSYVELSLKGPERKSRSENAKGVIDLARMDFSTPLLSRWISFGVLRKIKECSKGLRKYLY